MGLVEQTKRQNEFRRPRGVFKSKKKSFYNHKNVKTRSQLRAQAD